MHLLHTFVTSINMDIRHNFKAVVNGKRWKGRESHMGVGSGGEGHKIVPVGDDDSGLSLASL